MTDGKPQGCKHGCGQQIYTSDRSGKWMPYNVDDDQLHDCPKNPYKNFKNVAQKVEQNITSNPSVFKKTDALGKITEIETQLASDLKNVNSRISRLEAAVQALVKEVSFKKGTELKKHPEDPDPSIDEQVQNK